MPPGRYRLQPLKFFYLSWQLVALPVFYVPSWMFSGIWILLSEKKKGNWNLKRHLRDCLFARFLGILNDTEIQLGDPNHLAIGNGTNGIWIPALPSDLLVGEIGSRAEQYHVKSISIPGYWIHKSGNIALESPPIPEEKVLYHLHGGGYVFMSAHPDAPLAAIPKGILEHCNLLHRTFAVEFRLSTGTPPDNPFPTALIDALAGYMYLLRIGFLEKDIIIVGDSSGANLALALTRYLLENRERERRLPHPPASLVLLSPWVDLCECFGHLDPMSSRARFANHDWLSDWLKVPIPSIVGDDVKAVYTNPYISPASRKVLGMEFSYQRSISFKGFPRTFIDVGGFEVLQDQVQRLRDAMVEDLGEGLVMYNRVDGIAHDHTFFLSNEPDRTHTFKKIAKWLQEVQ